MDIPLYTCICGKEVSPYTPNYSPLRKCQECGYRPCFLNGKPLAAKEGEILATTKARTKKTRRKAHI